MAVCIHTELSLLVHRCNAGIKQDRQWVTSVTFKTARAVRLWRKRVHSKYITQTTKKNVDFFSMEFLSLGFRSWSSVKNFSFRGYVASNFDSYPTFRKTLNFPSSGYMCTGFYKFTYSYCAAINRDDNLLQKK